MEIKLDKNIGDGVWLMCDDQARFGKITDIHYRKFISNLDYETVKEVERYSVAVENNNGTKTVNCEKEDLFPDKASLIKSL